MINWNKSAKLNNCCEDELKAWFERFPKSNKKIIAICDNPKCRKERELYNHLYHGLCQSCIAKERSRTPDARKDQSIRANKQFEDPKQRKMVSELHKGKITSDETKHKQSESHKNSSACKKARAKTIGGNDIVNHHIAYDFDRPHELTVKVTRTRHGQIHNPKGQGIHERGYSLID